MKLLVLGAGMMGSAAAFDMARCARVSSVTVADADTKRARKAAATINRMVGISRKVRAVTLDVTDSSAVKKLMSKHDGTLSAVPYFFNLNLAKAAIAAGSHFADLGGNSVVVQKELALDRQATRRKVRLAPDCGLSPGMASILGGELMRRIGGRSDALKIYVGGLPQKPVPPFGYQLVFSVEGLINEYAEPAKVLHRKKLMTVEPLSEVESFRLDGMPNLEAFHTSGGTSTLPETYAGKVGECFEKTLRYPGHAAAIRALYDFGLFDNTPRAFGKTKLSPRQMMATLMQERFSGNAPEMTILRVEAHRGTQLKSFTIVDRPDPKTGMTSMMRTTAWPASIVIQMLVSGEVEKLGAVLQERDVPAEQFQREMGARGIEVIYESRDSSQLPEN
jgi:lysine 6-dehydrogenase